MPIEFKFSKGPKKKRNYQLTAKGQQRAEEYNIVGNKGEVVAALDRLETGTALEIANEAKLTKAQTINILRRLEEDGWVMVTGGD